MKEYSTNSVDLTLKLAHEIFDLGVIMGELYLQIQNLQEQINGQRNKKNREAKQTGTKEPKKTRESRQKA